METVTEFIFLVSKITADGDCSHEIKRHLLLGRKLMPNLDTLLKKQRPYFPTNQDHGIWSHHFMGNRWGNSGNSGWHYFGGLENHCRWWLQPWNQKTVTPWKESYDQLAAAAAAKSLPSCPTLRDPMDCSLPGSSAHGIFQARVLQWGVTAFSNDQPR